MEIKELVTFTLNESSQTLNVTFRLIEDSEDEIREDQIEFDEINKFGYSFLDNNSQKFKNLFEDEEYDSDYETFDDFNDDEFFEESIDEYEIISFLTEYYMVNEKKLPSVEPF